jgi:probable F420-dependent oxidoreductase
MRGYLQAMRTALYAAPPPPEPPLTIIAALGPRMLALAAELADGAHPYNVPPPHTAEARRLLGPNKLLCPEQMVVLGTNPSEARRIARAALSRYRQLENYVNNWRRLGFGDNDLGGGGSDRFLDANVAWGDEAAIRARIQEHWDAGADHVCIQPIRMENSWQTLDERVLELLTPAPRKKEPAND